MSSEDVSVIALEPFISRFVFTIIQNIRSHDFSYEERQVVHADLVPKVSEKVMMSSLKEKELPLMRREMDELVIPMNRSIMETSVKIPVRKPRSVINKPVMERLVRAPVRKPMPVLLPPPQPKRVQMSSPSVVPPQIQSVSPKVMTPSVSVSVESDQDYGRITPLLGDPVISLIECQGAGKPLMIIRAGQRQITRITLSPMEIKEVLEKISEGAHIPLLEGVFRAAVGNFSINAIISEMVGSRFVIRKQTPYSLLERQV